MCTYHKYSNKLHSYSKLISASKGTTHNDVKIVNIIETDVLCHAWSDVREKVIRSFSAELA